MFIGRNEEERMLAGEEIGGWMRDYYQRKKARRAAQAAQAAQASGLMDQESVATIEVEPNLSAAQKARGAWVASVYGSPSGRLLCRAFGKTADEARELAAKFARSKGLSLASDAPTIARGAHVIGASKPRKVTIEVGMLKRGVYRGAFNAMMKTGANPSRRQASFAAFLGKSPEEALGKARDYASRQGWIVARVTMPPGWRGSTEESSGAFTKLSVLGLS